MICRSAKIIAKIIKIEREREREKVEFVFSSTRLLFRGNLPETRDFLLFSDDVPHSFLARSFVTICPRHSGRIRARAR